MMKKMMKTNISSKKTVNKHYGCTYNYIDNKTNRNAYDYFEICSVNEKDANIKAMNIINEICEKQDRTFQDIIIVDID